MRTIEYKHVLKPSIAYLQGCGTLLLDSAQMAEFLGVPQKVFIRLVYTDRVPLPVQLGLGKCFRWNVLELLDWIAADCPRRTKWIDIYGHSGWAHSWS